MMRFLSWLTRLLGRAKQTSREVPRQETHAPVISEGDALQFEASSPTLTMDAEIPPVLTVTGATAILRREIAGDLLQFPGSRRIQTTDIVVGFDLGTSCSKIVVQSPYKLGGRAMAVTFGIVGHYSCRYLVPTQVFVNSRETISLAAAPDSRPVRHLKVGILDRYWGRVGGPDGRLSADPSICTAAYIALALRETRRWFLETQGESYGEDEIRWSLNLGVPSAGYDDAEIRREFEAIAKAAWLLSLEDRPLTMGATDAALQATRGGKWDAHIQVGVVPEVAAQVVGYAKSRHRMEGLHVLIDLGASTFDVSSFILRDGQGDDVYTMLTADVRPLGLLELHRRRMRAAALLPPFDRVPEDLVPALPGWITGQLHDEDVVQRLHECDADFLMECVGVLCKTIGDLRIRRDPISDTWSEGLPVFVCGGGMQSDIFTSFLWRAERRARNWWSMRGIRQMPMPPHRLVGGDDNTLASNPFNRLGVAYGLSHDAINIGTVEPPGEVGDVDVPRPRRPWEDGFIGPEQV